MPIRKTCPMCGAAINAYAASCVHCGENFRLQNTQWWLVKHPNARLIFRAAIVMTLPFLVPPLFTALRPHLRSLPGYLGLRIEGISFLLFIVGSIASEIGGTAMILLALWRIAQTRLMNRAINSRPSIPDAPNESTRTSSHFPLGYDRGSSTDQRANLSNASNLRIGDRCHYRPGRSRISGILRLCSIIQPS